MSAVPTVRIKSDIPGCEGGLDINESDFNPEIHEMFVEDAPVTRESIAKMKREDVIKLLGAHEMTEEDCKDVKLGYLRDLLVDGMFPE